MMFNRVKMDFAGLYLVVGKVRCNMGIWLPTVLHNTLHVHFEDKGC